MTTYTVSTQYRSPENDYKKEEFKKQSIVLHQTAGRSLEGAVSTLNKPNYVAVAYAIDQMGNIFNLYPCMFWSHHLGVQHRKIGLPPSYYDQRTVGVEIVNPGALLPSPSYPGWLGINWNPDIKVCKISETHKYLKVDKPWRGYNYFSLFTEEQVRASAWLCAYLTVALDIPKRICSPDARTSEHTSFEDVNEGGITTHIQYREGSQKQDLSLAWDWYAFEPLYKQHVQEFENL